MAEIKQVFTISHPRPVVWAQFQDLPAVVGCIPGATLTEQASPQSAKGRMRVKLGPVRADFGGEMTIAVDEANYTGTITGTGIDKNHSSRAKGTVTYKLEEVEGGSHTQVSVFVDYTLSGSLAQFARGGIVEAVADQICKDFTANLEEQLNASRAPAAPAPAESAAADGQASSGEAAAPARSGEPAPLATAPREAPRKSNELNVLKLILIILRNKLRALFGGR
jgi:carbon monoxide dehydrogenase subunit G